MKAGAASRTFFVYVNLLQMFNKCFLDNPFRYEREARHKDTKTKST